MSRDRILSLVVGVPLGILAILAVLTVWNAPMMDGIYKVILIAFLAAFSALLFMRVMVIPSAILLVVLSTILIVLINWGPIFSFIDNLVQLIFNSDRLAQSNIIVCAQDAGCKSVHAVLFTAIFLFVVITGFAYTTLLERRLIAWFQHRVGPNRVGPAGLLQPLADAIKLITKEDIIPSGVSRIVWFLAPAIKAVPILLVFGVIPMGPDIVIPWFAPSLGDVWYQIPLGLADPNVGVLWLLAVTSIGTYGVVLAGWASNNKYSMLGGLRASAQMISYELSMGLALAVPIMLAGSMSVRDIVDAQSTVPFLSWFVFQNPLAAAILIVALIAEVNRSPFDLPEAEQELTAGFMTEYSGMKFALFMMAEYLGMIAVSMIIVSMFFGGYHFLLVDQLPILGPLVMIGKVVLCLMGFIWIRATLPRIRYDRLMDFGWKVMLPLSLVAVAWTAISVVIGDISQNIAVYVVFSGALFALVVAGSLYFLYRAGEPVEDEEGYEDDPIITGERRGIGYVVLQLVGGLLGILFALVDVLVWVLEIPRKMGEKPQTEIVEAETPKRSAARRSGGG